MRTGVKQWHINMFSYFRSIAVESHIILLYKIEKGLTRYFNDKCGECQFLMIMCFQNFIHAYAMAFRTSNNKRWDAGWTILRYLTTTWRSTALIVQERAYFSSMPAAFFCSFFDFFQHSYLWHVKVKFCITPAKCDVMSCYVIIFFVPVATTSSHCNSEG